MQLHVSYIQNYSNFVFFYFVFLNTLKDQIQVRDKIFEYMQVYLTFLVRKYKTRRSGGLTNQ
jgi:hypothetical protein